jgi:hypothetical protein
MLRFRQSSPFPATPADDVRSLIADAMQPGNFFAALGLRLAWAHGNEEVFWELFRRLALDHTKTRRRQAFESWSILADGDDEPLISVKFDSTSGQVHVTRSILCRSWEGYVEGAEALSRETTRRIRELIGTVDLSRAWTAADLHDELIALLFLAVVGTSRLPLTSLEAPLPEFTLGQLAYCYRPQAGNEPIRSVEEWLRATSELELSPREQSRRLETAIRAGATIHAPADLIRAMFNDIALSPYTRFVARTLELLNQWVRTGDMTVTEQIDLLAHLLRQNARHVTSFDLVRFHHRGANYPDALLLDEVSREFEHMAAGHPSLLLPAARDDAGTSKAKRLRRRAMRQAWLIRRQYRGHFVPDAPTSPGDNARVLSEHVPEEQILDPTKRTRRLFDSDEPEPPIVVEILRHSVADLAESVEQRELGTGLFLDRPFGFAKARGEPDATIMLSHVAFSPRTARARLELLREFAEPPTEIDFAQFRGVTWFSPESRQRLGVVSVQDGQDGDFVFLHTTRCAVRQLCEQYDFGEWRDWMLSENCLILPSPERPNEVLVFDKNLQVRLSVQIDALAGYRSRAGVEYATILLRRPGPQDLRGLAAELD